MLHSCLERSFLLFRFLVDPAWAFRRFTFLLVLLLLAAAVVGAASAVTLQDAAEADRGLRILSAEETCVGDPWSKEKLNLPVSCRIRARNERGPEATEGFVVAVACAAEN